MDPEHDVHGPVAAYVLGALDPDELARFDAHVATCQACAADVQSLQRVTGVLARAVPERTPRPDVRERILAAIGTAPGRAAFVAPAPRPHAKGVSASTWLALAASLVAAVLGAYTIRLTQRLDFLDARVGDVERRASLAEGRDSESTLASVRLQATIDVLAAPDLTQIDLTGLPPAGSATGQALWSRARGMVFAASRLPALPPGRVYQVWVVTTTAPISAGLLTPDASGNSVAHFDTPSDIAPPQAIAVTIEPAGGVASPMGEKVLLGTVPSIRS